MGLAAPTEPEGNPLLIGMPQLRDILTYYRLYKINLLYTVGLFYTAHKTSGNGSSLLVSFLGVSYTNIKEDRSAALQQLNVKSGHWYTRASTRSIARAEVCGSACGVSCRKEDSASLDK